MAKKLTDQELKDVLNLFIMNLDGKIKIDKAILFGSYAKNTAHEWSDIDLMIISDELPIEKPKGANGFSLIKLAGLSNHFPGLEVIGINPQQLSNPVTKSFYDEIFTTGKEFKIENKTLEPISLERA